MEPLQGKRKIPSRPSGTPGSAGRLDKKTVHESSRPRSAFSAFQRFVLFVKNNWDGFAVPYAHYACIVNMQITTDISAADGNKKDIMTAFYNECHESDNIDEAPHYEKRECKYTITYHKNCNIRTGGTGTFEYEGVYNNCNDEETFDVGCMTFHSKGKVRVVKGYGMDRFGKYDIVGYDNNGQIVLAYTG